MRFGGLATTNVRLAASRAKSRTLSGHRVHYVPPVTLCFKSGTGSFELPARERPQGNMPPLSVLGSAQLLFFLTGAVVSADGSNVDHAKKGLREYQIHARVIRSFPERHSYLLSGAARTRMRRRARPHRYAEANVEHGTLALASSGESQVYRC